MTNEILIDISAAINQRAGIGRYARELTRRLIPLLDASSTRLWYAKDNSVYDPTLIERAPWSDLPIQQAPISRINIDRLFFRQNLPIHRLLRLGRPDDVYSPDFTAPAPGVARTHITVHDLAWFHPEAQTPAPLANFLAPVVECAVQKATSVFTVSETIRQELLQRYGLLPERVFVIPNAAADHFFDARPLSDEELLEIGLRRPFLLTVGTIEPRKNLPVLFEAMTKLPPTVQLAISGWPGWNAGSILSRIDDLQLTGRVVRLGFLSDTILPRVMAAAIAVVYPSFYEGFGLPIIEALATGVPVIASDLPVFREVGDRLVDYFDPRDADELVESIEQLFTQEDGEIDREARIARARHFDWQTSANIVANRLQGTI